eukprot:TRINITY_DN5840_c1_g1_i1.p1 TRINITY_DN5840_c1_g1~~TRINITY_DN5840_c1_g1_i1.p1  ORF type:complete len:735 (-),score=138.58 TRINITY_DN5840_c1_g1_i1:198-2402(-)
MPNPLLADSDVIVDCLIVGPALLGFIGAAIQWKRVAAVQVDGHPGCLELQDSQAARSTAEIVEDMKHICSLIHAGAYQFLFAEYGYMTVYIVLFSFVLLAFMPNQTGVATTISFVVGAITSILAGFIGMSIAVVSNVRVTHECWMSLTRGYKVAIDGGCVMGLCLVSIGVLDLFLLILILRASFDFETRHLYEAIAGYGLGGSSIALFGRVGGGIYTKAADVGADLSGKNEWGLNEDDYRNPACIADNVGDNVGDIAGMGADLFGSFAESTCAALVIAGASPDLSQEWCSIMYPVMISSSGIVVGVITLLICFFFYPVRDMPDVEKALKGMLVISTILMTPTVAALSYVSLPLDGFVLNEEFQNVQHHECTISVLMGLWSGLVIGFVTERYTSHSYRPVREIAETQKQSAATGIIYGLALGYLSCIVPVICLALTCLVAHSICGMFGVALGALGMLGTLTMALTIDAYGPISDNAGGIAEMAGLPERVRTLTDCLDAAGNTTAAIGKGFAIGSAALVSLALFGAFAVRAHVTMVNILNEWTFTGLLLGAMMPYAFAAMTMKSVGTAANDMVKECMLQFPEIMGPERKKPDYERCIRISTQASLREMIAPGALVILSPLIAGIGFGKNCCAGLLSGAMVSSVQLAISMSNTGGAWDNSKKYISAGGLGQEFCKGSDAHKNAVTGDTVGDPLKDTSGPSLNIVMKLTAIISLVFGSVIDEYSSQNGGPIWLKGIQP